MSTIIDALKRSDRERQINTTHTMSYSHLNAEEDQNKAWIKYLLIALVFTLCCIAAITFWFNKASVDTNSIPVETSSSELKEMQIIENEAPEVIFPKEEAPITEPSIAELPEPTVREEPVRGVKNSTLTSIVKPVTKSDIQQSEQASRRSLSELVSLPIKKEPIPEPSAEPKQLIETTQTELSQTQAELVIQANDFNGYDNYASIKSSQNLPELHLDILIYHPDSSQRKAFINMSAYRQGEQISEGAQLLEIGQKGVLLRYQGNDFVLSTN